MSKYKKGKIVKGVVTGIEKYGAFLAFDEYYTGLIHISEISNGFVSDIHNFINVGDQIYVEILEAIDDENHLKLSIKNINYKINGKYKRKKIIETPSGFKTLQKNLPIWLEKKLKIIEKNQNPIDKR